MTTSEAPESPIERVRSQTFGVRLAAPALVITFRSPCLVASWAPLHGGFRTGVSHLLNYQVPRNSESTAPETILRRAAGKMGIKGAFVGMLTSADVRQFSSAKAAYGGLCVSAISMILLENPATVGEPSTVEPHSTRVDDLTLIVIVNRHLTHEAMLEGMSLATEAKVKTMYELGLMSRRRDQPASGMRCECVAIASAGAGHHQISGKHSKLGELIGAACLESLRAAVHSRKSTSVESN